MKTSIIVLIVFILSYFSVHALSLDEIRTNYALAIEDKTICLSMINQLSTKQESSIHLAYLGAFKAIWASHVINPLDKLTTFNKGKNHIENALQLSPNSLEIIFIRHSVQTNSPSFLGYNNDVTEDRSYLLKNINTIDSFILKKMVTDLLKK